MNAKWKIAIHIAVTLIIGIAIGAALNRALVQKRIRDTLAMRRAGLRAPGGELPFKPADAAQEAKIQKVLDQHAQRLSEIHDRFRKEIEASFKSLESNLDPILTPEQKAQFEKMIPGPPPPMPGRPGGFPGGGGPGGPRLEERGPGGFPGGPALGAPGPGGPRPGGPGPMNLGPGGPPRGDMPFTRGPLGGQLGLAIMKAELKLSEEQAAKIRSIQIDFDKKIQWTPASPVPPPSLEVLRKTEQDMQEAILKILTDEQKEKLLRLRVPGFGGPRGPVPFP